MQGVKINDKHFEVIVRQMMRKVIIEDPGICRSQIYLNAAIVRLPENGRNGRNAGGWLYLETKNEKKKVLYNG